MTRTPIMKRLMTLFKKTHDSDQSYPSDLEKQFIVTKKTLGVGSFAVVKECIRRSDNRPFALKIILKKAIAGKEHMLDSELDILKSVEHPNIVSMVYLSETTESVYIVMELASGGELFQQLLQKGSYTEKDASNLVRQMLQGLAYLHDQDIVHRDIKPENLLFDTKEEGATLKITDFGLSKILKNHNDILMTACGTPGYVAPEILLQSGHGKPVDLWSVGVIMYTLLSGYTPFWGEDQTALFESIMSGNYEYDEEYWEDISDDAKDLIDRLLTYHPSKRITAKEALEHPWITKEHDENATNLAPNIRKGIDSRKSLKSVVTAMTLLNHWKNLEDVPEDEDETSDEETVHGLGVH
ncbi:hypothetical protein O0I10_001569 [Lichtheimia ornata]|uniref:Protein kinase domain-containing protein n=1 Tax=Lichtheimia ornata TaxID=688661 RepID=A0AAD7VBG4_9FUNG|nr:uncharacterized protein O0I10_001569 [Lichtheimia ornata]KAJ8662607.1 hypothetical protein O0I10_001569 [Lichtheimia ornata]